MKSPQFERTRSRIDQSMRRIYGDDPGKYHKKAIYETLPVVLKSYFGRRKGFLEVFEEINKTNLCFSEVIEVVMCYRLELGQALNNLNTSYNKLYEKLLEQCYKNDMDKEKELDERMHSTKETLAIV